MVYSAGFDDPYHLLRDLIVRGRLAPGAPLVEAEAAKHLGVSRTPVREALQRLRRDGLAVTAGGGERPRLAVAPLSSAAVFELYRAAGALEGVAARNVALLGGEDRSELASRMALHDSAFRRSSRASKPDWDLLFEYHDAFHRELQDASSGPHTRALLEALRPQVDRYEWFFAPLTGPDFSATYEEHDAIVRTVRSGTANALERAVRANWFNGAERLAAVIDQADAALLIGAGFKSAVR
ncbi:MAG: GntR family transcriptional regulator [bacterium]